MANFGVGGVVTTKPASVQVNWTKCDSGVWCSLEKVNLANVTCEGVYIIWHGGNNPRVVYVGQGNVKDRVSKHKMNGQIMFYRQHGLYVTWASVPSDLRDGVECYLADTWNPLVGDAHPDAFHIKVNSPWT